MTQTNINPIFTQKKVISAPARLCAFTNNALENKDLIIIYLMKLGYKQADVARITKKGTFGNFPKVP